MIMFFCLLAWQANEDPESNFVRKHALETAAELKVSVREAATRVFSNRLILKLTHLNIYYI